MTGIAPENQLLVSRGTCLDACQPLGEVGDAATVMLQSRGLGGMATATEEEDCRSDDLIDACRRGDIDLLKKLLKQWVTFPDGDDDVALVMAAAQGHASCVSSLLRIPSVDRDAWGSIALKLAMRNGHDAVMLEFLHAPGVHLADHDQQLLRECAACGLPACVGWLLDQSGVDVRARDHEALRLAAENGHTGVLQTLLSAGLRDNADVESMIHELDGPEYPDALTLRRALTVDPKKRSDPTANHHEALTLAARNGRLECVKALLQDGRTSPEENDFASVRAAMTANHPKVLECLVSALSFPLGNSVESELEHAARKGWEGVVGIAVHVGEADPSSGGMCVVQAAVDSRQVGVQRVLLDAEAALGAADFSDNWWLLHACEQGWDDIVERLLNVQCVSPSSKALEAACENRHKRVVVSLLGDTGVTAIAGGALVAACRGGDWEIVDAIVSSGKMDATTAAESVVQAVESAASQGHWHAVHRVCQEPSMHQHVVASGAGSAWPGHAAGACLKTFRGMCQWYGQDLHGLLSFCVDRARRTDAMVARATADFFSAGRRLCQDDVQLGKLLEYSAVEPSTVLHELAANKLWMALAVWIEAGGDVHEWRGVQEESAFDVAADGVSDGTWELLSESSEGPPKEAVVSLAGQGILEGWGCADGRDLVHFAASRWGVSEVASSLVRRSDCDGADVCTTLLEEAVRRDGSDLVELLVHLLWEEGSCVPMLASAMDVACHHGRSGSVTALLRVMKDGGLRPEVVGWDHWCRWEWWCTWWGWTDVLEDLCSCIQEDTEREVIPWMDTFLVSGPAEEKSSARDVEDGQMRSGWCDAAAAGATCFLESYVPMLSSTRSSFAAVIEWETNGRSDAWTAEVGIEGQSAADWTTLLPDTIAESGWCMTSIRVRPFSSAGGSDAKSGSAFSVAVFWESLQQDRVIRVARQKQVAAVAAGGTEGESVTAQTHRCVVSCDCEMETDKEGHCTVAWVQWYVDGEPVGERMSSAAGSIPVALVRGPSCRVRLCEPGTSLAVEQTASNGHFLPMLASQWGASPVHAAVARDTLSSLDALVSSGWHSVDAVDSAGRTALQWACMLGRRDAVEYLLQEDADVAVKDQTNGKKALHYACRVGDRGIVALLVQYGAGRMVADNHGATPLHVAVACGQWECGQEILRGAGLVEEEGALGILPSSVASDAWRTLRFVNPEDNLAEFPAVPSKSEASTESVCRAILSSDAVSAIRATVGFVRTHGKVERHIFDAFKDRLLRGRPTDPLLQWLDRTLFPADASVSHAGVFDGGHGHNPSIPAYPHAADCRIEAPGYLDVGAEIPSHRVRDSAYSAAHGPSAEAHHDHQPVGDDTALFLDGTRECEELDKDLVKAIKKGSVRDIHALRARVAEQDQFGWTPLHVAMVYGDEDVIAAVGQYAPRDSVSYDGVRASALRPDLWAQVVGGVGGPSHAAGGGTIGELVAMIADERVSTESLCVRACELAARGGGWMLDELDTDPRQVGSIFAPTCCWSILTAAARMGRYSLCRVCIELGAEVNMPDGNGVMPLHRACYFSRRSCALLLLTRGADPMAEDRHGRKAAHWALTVGTPDVDLGRVMTLAESDHAGGIQQLRQTLRGTW